MKVAPNYGIEILADETYGPRDSDMTAQLTKIKNTAGVQAVVNADFGQGPAIVTRNYAQLGMSATPLYQSHGVALIMVTHARALAQRMARTLELRNGRLEPLP